MKLAGSCHCNRISFTVESKTPYPYRRCYCVRCRKTNGGSGYVIKVMGEAETLQVEGRLVEHGDAANLLEPFLKIGTIRIANPVAG